MLTRTTLRLETSLKKSAEKLAIDQNTTLQKIINNALNDYLNKSAKKHAKKIIFKTLNLGEPLDNLTRDDFYPDPKV